MCIRDSFVVNHFFSMENVHPFCAKRSTVASVLHHTILWAVSQARARGMLSSAPLRATLCTGRNPSWPTRVSASIAAWKAASITEPTTFALWLTSRLPRVTTAATANATKANAPATSPDGKRGRTPGEAASLKTSPSPGPPPEEIYGWEILGERPLL